MSKTYQRIDIKSEADLPKEIGYYPVHQKRFEPDYFMSMMWTGLKNSLWESAYDYYLQPIADKEPIERKELKCWNCERPIVFIPNGLPAYRCSCGAVSPESKPIEPQKPQESADFIKKYRERLAILKENRANTVDSNTDAENELYDKLIEQVAEICRDLKEFASQSNTKK